MKQPAASRWMQTPNYGRAISSYAARYSARYYRSIIAFLVVTLLALQAVRSGPVLLLVTAVGGLLYLIYVIVRLRLPSRWMRRYYTPRVQFWRAQAGILGLTVLLVFYAVAGQSLYLGILYLLSVMIVSEHCSTLALLFTLVEVGAILIGLGYLGSGLTLVDYLTLSPAFFTAAFYACALLLLGFLLHYLVCNVDARNRTISHYRTLLNVLADDVRSLYDPHSVRMLVLNTVKSMRNAACCAIWSLDAQSGRLRLTACTDDEECSPDCLANGRSPDFSIPLNDDRLPACVARTGEPYFASRADHPPTELGEMMLASRPFLPHARLELGIPIPDFQPHQPTSLAVLTLAFDRPMERETMEQEYGALSEMARYLSHVLYHASLLEQYQALQGLIKTVTNSLDTDHILNMLLDLVTSVFGFDVAVVSLVDEAEGLIRVAAGRNMSQEWAAAASCSLDGENVWAEVVRTGQWQVVVDQDDCLDRAVREMFDSQHLVRILVPMTVTDPVTGEEKSIGVLEAGCLGEAQRHISQAQARLLLPLAAQAAVAMVNARLHAQAQSKAEALTALHHGGHAIQATTLEPKRLLKQIGQSAEQVLGADIVVLFEYDEVTKHADLVFVGGDLRGKGDPAPRLGQGNILDAIIEERGTFYYPDAQREPFLVGYGDADGSRRRTFTQRQDVVSFAGVPLMSGEELLGIMCVNYRSRHSFKDDERRLIELFAQQAAITLEIARRHERERQLAVTQERTALARELHQSVSHDLFAVVLKARTALHHLEAQDGPVTKEVRDILHIADGANHQLGYLISEFNAADPEGEDFQTVLERSVDRIRRFYGIEVVCEGSGEAHLSPHTHFALSRIVKEALNNIIRHANCERVTVVYVVSPQEITLEITDDGVGFKLDQVLHRDGKFGLKNLQDYACELGGMLVLDSAPEEGTRIALRVPLPATADDQKEER